MRKLLSIVICLVLLVSCLCAFSACGEKETCTVTFCLKRHAEGEHDETCLTLERNVGEYVSIVTYRVLRQDTYGASQTAGYYFQDYLGLYSDSNYYYAYDSAAPLTGDITLYVLTE